VIASSVIRIIVSERPVFLAGRASRPISNCSSAVDRAQRVALFIQAVHQFVDKLFHFRRYRRFLPHRRVSGLRRLPTLVSSAEDASLTDAPLPDPSTEDTFDVVLVDRRLRRRDILRQTDWHHRQQYQDHSQED
jgi:hypothetical protein